MFRCAFFPFDFFIRSGPYVAANIHTQGYPHFKAHHLLSMTVHFHSFLLQDSLTFFLHFVLSQPIACRFCSLPSSSFLTVCHYDNHYLSFFYDYYDDYFVLDFLVFFLCFCATTTTLLWKISI